MGPKRGYDLSFQIPADKSVYFSKIIFKIVIKKTERKYTFGFVHEKGAVL